MAWVDEVAKQGAYVVPLGELELDSGTLNFAPPNCPVESATKTYAPRLLNAGGLDRKSSDVFAGLQTMQYDVTLANEDGSLSVWDPDKIINRIWRQRLLAGGISRLFFTGAVIGYQYLGDGSVVLTIADISEQYLSETNQWWRDLELKSEDWGALPSDSVGKIAPIVWGNHDSRGAGFAGMLRTIELSPTEFIVAGHAMKCVSRVFVGGLEQQSGWTVDLDYPWSNGINDLCTIITFKSAPSGSITCDGQGITDDRTSSGALLLNAVDILEILREYIFNLTDSYVNSTQIALARIWANKYHLRLAGKVETNRLAKDILAEALSCAMLAGGVDRNGEWSIWYLDIPLTPSGGISVTERVDMARQSFSATQDTETICNDLRLRYLPNASSVYLGDVRVQHSQSQTDLGRTYQAEQDLPQINEREIARTIGELSKLIQGYAMSAGWTDALHRIDDLDLMSQVDITHSLGPDTGGSGWVARAMGVTALMFTPTGEGGYLRAEAQDWSRITTASLGSGFNLGDNLPGDVL